MTFDSYHDQTPWPGPPQPPFAPLPPDPANASARRVVRRTVGALGVCGLVAGAIAGGYALHGSTTVAGSGSSVQASGNGSTGSSGSGGTSGSGTNGYGGYGYGGNGYGGYGYGGSGGSGNSDPTTTSATTSATAAQSVGVVDIDTVLKYQSARAAGTGMVLTSNGEILTNNHVVNGATSISVTVVSTGATYTATVVGTDPTQDVAVLQLQNASGLAVAKLGDSSSVKVADKITAVGNAGGTGGTPTAAPGTIAALNQSITATDDDGSNPENLTGLFEIDAAIQAGDSGGPLYNAAGAVIGMDTAAQTSRTGSTIAGYAIPIATAEQIAAEIEAGQSSSTVHLGYPAFLGVSINTATSTSGALVAQTVSGGPADQAGIAAGDTITNVGGTAVTSPDSLQSAIRAHQPGDQVSITWTDTSGQSHHATVTLIQGPAD